MDIVHVRPCHILRDGIIGFAEAAEHDQEKHGQKDERNGKNASHDSQLAGQIHILDHREESGKSLSYHVYTDPPCSWHDILYSRGVIPCIFLNVELK